MTNKKGKRQKRKSQIWQDIGYDIGKNLNLGWKVTDLCPELNISTYSEKLEMWSAERVIHLHNFNFYSFQPAQHGVQLPAHPTQCPLCKNVRTNPTALGSSGYVFCYPCIHRYLSQHGCCPVTHLPSTPHQLVRLYVGNGGEY